MAKKDKKVKGQPQMDATAQFAPSPYGYQPAPMLPIQQVQPRVEANPDKGLYLKLGLLIFAWTIPIIAALVMIFIVRAG